MKSTKGIQFLKIHMALVPKEFTNLVGKSVFLVGGGGGTFLPDFVPFYVVNAPSLSLSYFHASINHKLIYTLHN